MHGMVLPQFTSRDIPVTCSTVAGGKGEQIVPESKQTRSHESRS